jgi:HAE1 family hydrophobic/amphiphilic exporter-1
MNIPRIAVHRPVSTVMMVLIILILGGISLARLPSIPMPNVTYPTLTVGPVRKREPEEVEQPSPARRVGHQRRPGVGKRLSSSFGGDEQRRVTFPGAPTWTRRPTTSGTASTG